MTDFLEINNSFPLSEQPEKIKKKLKNHQLALLNQCKTLEDNDYITISNIKAKSKIGIIRDKVGSGKSLIILSIIAQNKVIDRNIKNTKCCDLFSIEYPLQEIKVFDTNIIVIPHTLSKQWEHYITNDSNLTYYCVKNKKTIDKIKDNISELKNYDVILVINTRYNELSSLLYNKKVSRVFYDEADSIKIPNVANIEASFYWIVSSSYKNLLHPMGQVKWANQYNDLADHYNYYEGFTNRVIINGITSKRGFLKNALTKFASMNSNYLGNVMKYFILKNNDNFINQSFNLPDPRVIKIKCKNPLIINLLSNVINSSILDSVNAGDISGAIEKINCKKVEENNLLKVVTEDIDTQISNKKIELEMKSKMTFSSDNSKKEILDKIIKKIDELEKKRKNLEMKLNENTVCPICYDEAQNVTLVECCKTKFCFECLSLWLASSKTCPHCRQNINSDNLIVTVNQELKPDKSALKSKLEELENIISRMEPTDKVLIFSGYSNSFYKISDILDKHNKKHSQISGNSNSINKILSNYRSSSKDKIDILMLNSNFFGSGLNLENTTHVIIYHKMTDELTQQVIGRAQRPGREKQLIVYKLFNEQEY